MKVGIVYHIKLQPLPFTCFSIHCPLIMLRVNADTPTMSVNIPRVLPLFLP